MAIVAKIDGVDRLVKKLLKIAADHAREVNVVVGFNAKYAVYLHEMGEPGHRLPVTLPGAMGVSIRTLTEKGVVKGQKPSKSALEAGGASPRPSGLGYRWGPSFFGPKFLERPAREMGRELGLMIATNVGKGMRLVDALELAGLRLQRAAQDLVPFEYGNLRGSAFTEVEWA